MLWKENHQPYGGKLNNHAAASSNAIGFAGKPYDNATGLSYLGARYYHPALGRFMGLDPVGFDTNNIHSHNRYAYANNNPYRFVDPDGRSPVAIVWGAVAISLTAYSAYQGYQTMGWAGFAGALGDAGQSLLAGSLAGVVANSAKNSAVNVATGAARSAAPVVARADFVVTPSGVAVPNSPSAARAALEGAGLKGVPVSNRAKTEFGTVHNVPDMKMDIRVMDGGPVHGARVVTTNPSNPKQNVNPVDGNNFGNISKTEQRERGHISIGSD